MSPPRVQAAGGVVWKVERGELRVILVHRPKYDDWTLPKGKLESGETHEQAARREVEEETGFRCKLGQELLAVSYRDSRGRPKTVRYWEMTVTKGSFAPNSEVDELVWVAPDRALRLLTYEHDRPVITSFIGCAKAKGFKRAAG